MLVAGGAVALLAALGLVVFGSPLSAPSGLAEQATAAAAATDLADRTLLLAIVGGGAGIAVGVVAGAGLAFREVTA